MSNELKTSIEREHKELQNESAKKIFSELVQTAQMWFETIPK